MKLFTATAAALLALAGPAQAQSFVGEYVDISRGVVTQCRTSAAPGRASTSCREIPFAAWYAGKKAGLEAAKQQLANDRAKFDAGFTPENDHLYPEYLEFAKTHDPRASETAAEAFWAQWRARQNEAVEQAKAKGAEAACSILSPVSRKYVEGC